MIFDMQEKTVKIIGGVFYLVLVVVVIWALIAAFNKLSGNQDSSVRGQQQVVINDLSNTNANLTKTLDIQKKAGVIDQDIVNTTTDKQKQNSDTKSTSHQNVENKITELRKEYNDKISKAVDPQESLKLIKEKEIAVSTARVKSLWVNFCKQEPQDEDCKGVKL